MTLKEMSEICSRAQRPYTSGGGRSVKKLVAIARAALAEHGVPYLEFIDAVGIRLRPEDRAREEQLWQASKKV